MSGNANLRDLANELEQSGDYRVLKRLVPPLPMNFIGAPFKRGLLIDTETTGLDYREAELIEIALVPFEYSTEGKLVTFGKALDQFQQPKSPISEEITKLTGITNEMVAGQKIDIPAVEQLIKESDLIIAHNAAFDRPFAERLTPAFKAKPWACSLVDIDWKEEGYESPKLSFLAMEHGFYYKAHRADIDCWATIKLLAQRLKTSGDRAMAHLLTSAREERWRIWATNTNFAKKDILKNRGYRWESGENGKPKSWYADIAAKDKEAELEFLKSEIYDGHLPNIPMIHITALNRFSADLD
ncbi:3'-5' exonuclease [Hirschia baltica]|uniref:Exonuclease RNase T and DNA polymerase III n=1 Tax=Hirschia baltica (strain ATCC 49814 / DSM 5838 / IFAM 1418) TaxID=582402 RepID=C6XJL2_HIRBI|nr:3'-5' exonuclease [Hirschia baltica]ACT59307.1 Exonuclease RNase T and DNA polymerase III [Hirschia baltica ATCC 49814]